MASDTHPEGDHHLQQENADSTKAGTPGSQPTNTSEAPSHGFILTHQESQGFLVTSPQMSEASLADESHHQTTSASAGVGASSANKTDSMDSIEYTNGHPSRVDNGSSSHFRSPTQSSAPTHTSGQYHLSVATFHKRNQDTNSFRTGQQFLIKLDLKAASGEPLNNPMSLILPRRMIQGHQKARQADTNLASTASTSADNQSGSTSDSAATTGQPHDNSSSLTGDPESHFYLEVTVHLASSEAIVQACPECCHKVEGKVRKPSTGPGAPSKAHATNDNVDPGQILQFCVSEHVVDFTLGTSTVMAKVLCSSTHHDKRGNNDRYFFKFSLVQYLGDQKIRVGSCRTKDILFTGNHKNKSMASYSEDKPRIQRIEDDGPSGIAPPMVTGQSFFSEEPDSIPDELFDKYGHAQSPYSGGRSQHGASHSSFTNYSSPRHYNSDHIPRIHEPSSPLNVDSPRLRQPTIEKESYSNLSTRSSMSVQSPGSGYTGPSNANHASLMVDSRPGMHSGFSPIRSRSLNDTLSIPKITKIIPDVGDMLGGTEVTIFGSGFRGKRDIFVLSCACLTCFNTVSLSFSFF
ncbi:hypothetical protein BCR41DRAFT_21784 [Lobosporangium transversale]|uniref:IPT/TIG domain-containing protein n=1 Tax=Lobosporangium transversale TaxID=64571 RepID=A0A1Y2GUZ6_9FUNG|nr:hypothetical protein BCR41DRAFT_21784 [Lobosporangium transversale]ORZ21838.1 hypothetical protein BCR41DRAFT_21784 [Lobosporangium transversale]|eukprot:XP_021883089.1 hypothetical protein BCR41DRAFT_21784 [Lobosporangium transversale]